jgi:ABC-2 type transport system ATP-binding protein
MNNMSMLDDDHNMIDVDSLRVDYDNITAVDHLSLHIPRGQIFGLVGPNGAGKTSTIKALAGILQPTSGQVRIAGYDLESRREKALMGLCYMPDFPPVYENLRVWEYLDIFAAAYKVPYKERILKVRLWLDKVQLTSKFDALIKDLSRGMRQRLVLAKSLLPDPKVLLLDEPASGLDPLSRSQMRGLLLEATEEERTILISSHILTELRDFCNAIGIIEKGRLVVSGTLSEIRQQLQMKKKIHVLTAESYYQYKFNIRKYVKEHPHLHDIEEINTNKFILTFSGNNKDASRILSELVDLGLNLANFHVKEDDIEDIFFQIGAKEVS